MSLVLDTRDVPLGPTAAASGLDASPPYSADLRGCGDSRRASACYVGGDGVLAGASQKRAGLQSKFGGSEEDASSESSSIGVPDDSDGGSDDEDEVQSTLSLGSLEDSLPIKRRGLSNYYTGRSKSFANLTEVRSVNDLGKAESPFNKRRRSLIAYKLSNNLKKSSFYGHSSHISMPLLPLNEEDDGSGVDDGDGDGDSSVSGGRGCDIRAATKQRSVTVNEDEDVEEDDERPNKSHKSLGFLLY